MKAIVNGTITFGLVNVPVGVCSSVKTTNEPKFKLLHEACGKPVSVKRANGGGGLSVTVCEPCGVEIEAEDQTVRGFEYAKGEFVTFTNPEYDKLTPERAPTIELTKFVKSAEILPTMIDKQYFLAPNDVLKEPYGLLFQALTSLKVSGIGVQTLWGKEHPCAVVASKDFSSGVLIMQSLHLAEDLVEPDFKTPIPGKDASALAKQFVQSMTGVLEPAKDMASPARKMFQDAIAAKIEGRELAFPEARELPQAPDTIAALKESIARAQKKGAKTKAR